MSQTTVEQKKEKKEGELELEALFEPQRRPPLPPSPLPPLFLFVRMASPAPPPPLLDPVVLLTTALSAPEPEQRGHLQRAKSVLELQPSQIPTIVGYILPFSTAPGLISDWMVEVSCTGEGEERMRREGGMQRRKQRGKEEGELELTFRFARLLALGARRL